MTIYQNEINLTTKYATLECIGASKENPFFSVGFGQKVTNDFGIADLFFKQCVNEQQTLEVWLAEGSFDTGKDQEIIWSENSNWLFSAIEIDIDPSQSITHIAQDAYKKLLTFIQQRGYSSLVRVWNSVPNINQGDGDDERYRQFCVGRHNALIDCNYSKNQFSSASAVGNHSDKLVISLLTTHDNHYKINHYENPYQQSAYQYPKVYSPKSPSFARATLITTESLIGNKNLLFVSGTASIRGHETLFDDCFDSQLELSIENVTNLIDSVSKDIDAQQKVELNFLRVYVRYMNDFERAKAIIEKHYPCDIPVLYVQADICRSDLLVEIEGHCEF